MPRNVLEIGPGPLPSHHEGGLHLDEGDSYTAVDQSTKVFNSAIWREIESIHGEQVRLLVGDRKELPAGEYDEIVSLGSWGNDTNRITEQAGSLLKPGGKLIFGTGWGMQFNVADFLDKHHQIAKDNGFKYDKSAGKQYNYGKIRAEQIGKNYPKVPYATIVFVKQ